MHVNAKGVNGFLCSTQTWGIGYSTIEHTYSHRQTCGIRLIECRNNVVETEQCKYVEYNNAHSHEVHLHTVFFKRLKETRTNLQTDTVDKENQAKVLDKRKYVSRTGISSVRVGNAELVVDVAYHNAGKQHEGNAQWYTSDLDFAEYNAYSNHKREE